MADNGQYDSQINLEPEEYEQETTIEQEEYELETTIEQGDSEQEITMQPEAATVYGGSIVNSINGQVGDVILTTSDLENTSDYQTGEQVQSAIAGKQDKLTAGTNIQINNDVISATDTTYSAGSGLNLSGTTFSVDTNTIATVQDVTNEATTRENSDANLQGQIDALTVSSDVIDVLGTYQDLQNYDTSHVKANDIIKVLQDSTHNNAMSYYRWVATSNAGSWVYVGSEGPYYTKSEADALLNDKQNTEDNSLDTTSKTVVGAINEVNSIAKGSNQALSFANYSAMVTEFNSLAGNEYSVGQNIMVVTLEVPDLWISGIESTSSTYTYTTDEAFTTALATNGYVQVGYYKLSALETQKVDLTNYVTNTDYASNNTGGVVKTNTNYGTSVDSNGSLRGTTKTYAEYDSMHSLGLISKVTLENVIEGKGLVSEADLADYVKNTDYATSSTAGIVRIGTATATYLSSDNRLSATTRTYADYTSGSDAMFVGKGTLENVIEGKGLVDQTALAGKQDTLVSGTNIKTVNSTSLLGSGNINIPVITVDSSMSSSSTNPVQNKVINTALASKIQNDDIIQNLNAFVSGTHKLFLSTIDNCLYSADQRFTVTGTGFGTTFGADRLFNGTYEDYASNNISVGGTGTIVISGTAITGTYRQGYMLISFYSGRNPVNLTDLVVTIENAAGNVATPVLSWEGTNKHVVRATVPTLPTANAISKITISITNNRTSGVVAPVEIEYFVARPSSLGLLPVPLKNSDNTFYRNITAPKFIKTGGTSSQFLKADGSVDSNTYAKTSQLPTIDSALSSTSTNPVQNKVIYAAIGDVETVLQTLNSGSGV